MYDFTRKIADTNYPRLWLVEEIAAELDIDVLWSNGEPDPIIRDVYLYGERVPSACDNLTAALCKRIKDMAYAEIKDGGQLFEDIKKREGFDFTGHPGDPDAHWEMVA